MQMKSILIAYRAKNNLNENTHCMAWHKKIITNEVIIADQNMKISKAFNHFF